MASQECLKGKVNLSKVPGLLGLRTHLQGYLTKSRNISGFAEVAKSESEIVDPGEVKVGKLGSIPGSTLVASAASFPSNTMLVPPSEPTPNSPESLPPSDISSGFESELNNTITDANMQIGEGECECDLEAVGTEWVDATEEMSENSSTTGSVNFVEPQVSWSQVVSRRQCKVPYSDSRPSGLDTNHNIGEVSTPAQHLFRSQHTGKKSLSTKGDDTQKVTSWTPSSNQ